MSLGSLFDSSSKSTTDASTQGAQSQAGPAVSVQGGGKKSQTTVNVQQTDLGALAAAEGIAKESLISSENTSRAALEANRDVVKQTAITVERTTSDAFLFGRDSLETVTDAIDANRDISKEALFTAGSVVKLTEDINAQNTNFLKGTLQETTMVLKDLDESRSLESGKVLGAVTELAKVVQTNGESITAGLNKYLIWGALALAGLVAWRASA